MFLERNHEGDKQTKERVFGAVFVAMEMGVDILRGLRYKLRMMVYKKQEGIEKKVHCIVDPWDGSVPFTVLNGIRTWVQLMRFFIRDLPILT